MPLSDLPRALTSFFIWDYFLRFVFRETCQYTLVFNIYDGFNQFFLKTKCWWEFTCIAVSWDNTTKATLLQFTGVWQSLGFWVWREVCVGGGIAWAGYCPFTNLPSFLTTVKITILLSNKDGINHNPTGSLLYSRTTQGLLPLPRKCVSQTFGLAWQKLFFSCGKP